MKKLLFFALSIIFLGIIAVVVLKLATHEPTVVTTNVNMTTAPQPNTTTTTTTSNTNATIDLTVDSNGLSKATVAIKVNKGTMKFKFYSKDAPQTIKRFIELIQSNFYNSLSFHRVVPGFVVQTGDPKSKNKNDPTVGTGGSGLKLKAEFNSRKHIRGAVAMARAVDPDSADSQFYICLGTFPHLDNNYTIIGQVIDYGEKVGDKDVLDRITLWDELMEIRVE